MTDLKQKAYDLRCLTLDVFGEVKNGHISPSFSVIDILTAVFYGVMNENDSFILSKGHAALGYYSVLADKGYFPKEELYTFMKYKSRLGGHPDRNKIPGVYASTGSLGHGLPTGAGISMGQRLQNKAGRVFVLVGDGELNEGSNWETAIVAAHQSLKNLCCIVDNNKSINKIASMGDIAAKFKSFGWETCDIDGHNTDEIANVLKIKTDKPLAVIAHTIKGKGSKYMEDNAEEWHHKVPTDAEVRLLKEGLY